MVNRHKGLESLSNDHHNEMVFSQRLLYGKPENSISSWPKNDDLVAQVRIAKEIFSKNLLPHFKAEEILFNEIKDQLKNEGGKDLIKLIIEQHKILENKFMQLTTDGVSKEELTGKLREIGGFLENHISIEEGQLFPLIEKELNKDVLLKIGELLETRKNYDFSHLL